MFKEEDRVSTMNPVFAVVDRKQRDEKNRVLYTEAQRRKGSKLKEDAYLAYGIRPQVFLNFQENFMTVKVAKPTVSEKNSSAVATFNARCLSEGIQIKEHLGNILYNFL